MSITPRIVRNDGTIRHIHSIAQFEFHEDGTPTGLYGVAHDITDMKEAENALQQSTANLRLIVDLIPQAIFAKNYDGKFVFANKSFAKLYGLTPEELVHKNLQETISRNNDPSYFLEQDREVINTGRTKIIPDTIFTDYSGKKRIFNTFKLPYTIAGSDEKAVLGIATDITDQKLAEAKIKHSEARLKQAQEIANYGGYEVDFSTKTAIWSDQFCKIYGLPADDNVHSIDSWFSFVHPEDMGATKKLLEEANLASGNINFYYRIIRRDGTIRRIHSYRQIEHDNDNNQIGAYVVAHDITDEVNNMIQLKVQNEQLRQIAWIQSHKVRGPLATILGLAQLFKNKEFNVETEEIIDGILESSEKLDIVIREIVGKTATTDISEKNGGVKKLL